MSNIILTIDDIKPEESEKKRPLDHEGSSDQSLSYAHPLAGPPRPKLPLFWQFVMILLTCSCTFGNHWSNGLIVALKTTIESNLHINNSKFAALVAVTNLMNTFLCVGFGFVIDRFGGPLLTVILAFCHLAGALIESGAATNHLNSYNVLIAGKIIAAIGDGSLDNAQHRIFATYFAPGKGLAFSIGTIWSMANLAQFTGQSTANVIAENLGSFAWPLWISSAVSLFSFLCAIAVFFLDRYLQSRYNVIDHTARKVKRNPDAMVKSTTFSVAAVRHLPLTFWIVILFSIFENSGVQSFLSISTQFAQQRLKTGAVIGGWVSSFYLLLPVGLTPFLGIFIDRFGHRISFLFLSGLTFLMSMLLLEFSVSVPAFVSAYVLYAISQSITPAPQVEIIRSIIPDPHFYSTAFAIKKSIVQASIVIIVTAAGKIQDLSPTASLANSVTLWLVYAFVSVLVSGALLLACYTTYGKQLLPAARLSQVCPRKLGEEVDLLWRRDSNTSSMDDALKENADNVEMAPEDRVLQLQRWEHSLKSPVNSSLSLYTRWGSVVAGLVVVVIAWVIFGLGIEWGVHGDIIAGTVGD